MYGISRHNVSWRGPQLIHQLDTKITSNITEILSYPSEKFVTDIDEVVASPETIDEVVDSPATIDEVVAPTATIDEVVASPATIDEVHNAHILNCYFCKQEHLFCVI